LPQRPGPRVGVDFGPHAVILYALDLLKTTQMMVSDASA